MSHRIHCLHQHLLLVVVVLFTVSVVAPINGLRTDKKEILGPLVPEGDQSSGNECPPYFSETPPPPPPYIYTPTPPVGMIYTPSTPSPPPSPPVGMIYTPSTPSPKKEKPCSPAVMSSPAPPPPTSMWPYTASGANENVLKLAVLFGGGFLCLLVFLRF